MIPDHRLPVQRPPRATHAAAQGAQDGFVGPVSQAREVGSEVACPGRAKHGPVDLAAARTVAVVTVWTRCDAVEVTAAAYEGRRMRGKCIGADLRNGGGKCRHDRLRWQPLQGG